MDGQPTVGDMMAAYALDAVDHAKSQGVVLDFSRDSVQAVERILDSMFRAKPKGFMALFRRGPSRQVIESFGKMYGGYVGEVLRRTAGGEWYFDDEVQPGTRWVGLRHEGNRVWPPMKVMKRLVQGAEDNVWHYFQAVLEDWPSGTSGT